MNDEWPALRGELDPTLRPEPGVWGKVHGQSEHRWIGLTRPLRGEARRIAAALNVGDIAEPVNAWFWRVIDGIHIAMALRPARGRDQDNRPIHVETQVLVEREAPGGVSPVAVAAALLGAVSEMKAERWLGFRNDFRDLRYVWPMEDEAPVLYARRSRLLRALEEGRAQLASVGAPELARFYARHHARPAASSSLRAPVMLVSTRPLSWEALLVLLLPLTVAEAGTLSIAGWTPSPATGAMAMALNWDWVVAPAWPRDLEPDTHLEPGLWARSAANAVLEGEPERLVPREGDAWLGPAAGVSELRASASTPMVQPVLGAAAVSAPAVSAPAVSAPAVSALPSGEPVAVIPPGQPPEADPLVPESPAASPVVPGGPVSPAQLDPDVRRPPPAAISTPPGLAASGAQSAVPSAVPSVAPFVPAVAAPTAPPARVSAAPPAGAPTAPPAGVSAAPPAPAGAGTLSGERGYAPAYDDQARIVCETLLRTVRWENLAITKRPLAAVYGQLRPGLGETLGPESAPSAAVIYLGTQVLRRPGLYWQTAQVELDDQMVSGWRRHPELAHDWLLTRLDPDVSRRIPISKFVIDLADCAGAQLAERWLFEDALDRKSAGWSDAGEHRLPDDPQEKRAAVERLDALHKWIFSSSTWKRGDVHRDALGQRIRTLLKGARRREAAAPVAASSSPTALAQLVAFVQAGANLQPTDLAAICGALAHGDSATFVRLEQVAEAVIAAKAELRR